MPEQMIKLTAGIDFQAIVERLKKKGLNVTEDALVAITHEFFVVAAESIQKAFPFLSPLLLPLLKPLEAAIDKEVDKIDGEIG